MKKNPRIVIIGGGTGTFVTLSGLKKYPVDLSAIVTMMDSGGSSGKLRDELGVLPPGDVRQCLVALSHSSQTLRELFMYRFTEGSLKGHTFGNIFLSALEKTTGTMKDAIKQAADILHIQGNVIPVTFDQAQLCVTLVDGTVITGETHIDEVEAQVNRPRIKKAFLTPHATANPDAIQAILSADLVVLGPGDLYTSIIPNLLVKGIIHALQKSPAKKLFVMNLMTKKGQTTDYSAQDHLDDLSLYLGDKTITHVLINTGKPTEETREWYRQFGEVPVQDNLSKKSHTLLHGNIITRKTIEKNKADTLTRSIIRHDSDKLAKQILRLLSQ